MPWCKKTTCIEARHYFTKLACAIPTSFMDSSVSDYNISCTVFRDSLQLKKTTDYFSSSFGSINIKIIIIIVIESGLQTTS